MIPPCRDDSSWKSINNPLEVVLQYVEAVLGLSYGHPVQSHLGTHWGVHILLQHWQWSRLTMDVTWCDRLSWVHDMFSVLRDLDSRNEAEFEVFSVCFGGVKVVGGWVKCSVASFIASFLISCPFITSARFFLSTDIPGFLICQFIQHGQFWKDSRMEPCHQLPCQGAASQALDLPLALTTETWLLGGASIKRRSTHKPTYPPQMPFYAANSTSVRYAHALAWLQ